MTDEPQVTGKDMPMDDWRQVFKTLWLCLRVLVITAGIWVVLGFFTPTGCLFERNIIETLDAPVAVNGWTEEGLRTEDGNIIRLPGIARLPQQSRALREAIRHGAELNPDGRVYGLIRVWHWCGNDPVGEHLARVDLSHLLIFYKHDGSLSDALEMEYQREREEREFHEDLGWLVGEYYGFKDWEDSQRTSRGTSHNSSH